MPEAELIWDAQCDTAESPVWDERARRVLFTDMHGGRILSYGVDDAKQQEWTLPGAIGSFGVAESGRLVVALGRRVVMFDLTNGKLEELTAEVDEPPGHRFNDGKVGPDGCFWVGTSSPSAPIEERARTSKLYRIRPDGVIEEKSSGYVTTNGIAWSADTRTLYHSDSPLQRVDAWDFDRSNGEITNRRVFKQFTPGDCRPDGAACDADGNYWSAGVRNGCLFQFSPSGELLTKLDMPCESPSMPCFAGDSLFVTSLIRREAEITQNRPFNVGGLWRLDAPIAGAEVGRFADL